MEQNNIIKGVSEDGVWQQIGEQFQLHPDPLNYSAIIEHGSHRIEMEIDIDLGGGFESGYETTSFTAAINASTNFRFAIHEAHFTDEIGKFFGMQDVIIGYEEFDKKLIIKTNDAPTTTILFADKQVRILLQGLSNFTFGITSHTSEDDTKKLFLELLIETGITNVKNLRAIYHAFFQVLTNLETASLEKID